MSFSIKLGNFLYKNAFSVYKPMYALFKQKQDAFEIALLKKHIKPNHIVLDIGANIGFYAKVLSAIVGEKGLVHCFEPDVKNFNYLKKATSRLTNVKLNNKAVGSKTEKINIYTSKNLNVDHRTYKPEEYDMEIEIDAVSIDDYLLHNTNIDFIKIDIQGYEMKAIQGMRKILEKNQAIKMISEFWPYGLRKSGSSVNEYFNFLILQGFHCYLLQKNSLLPLSPEKVKSMEMLGEEHYFNIFVTRTHV
jgi:FkbM family methyltransferase